MYYYYFKVREKTNRIRLIQLSTQPFIADTWAVIRSSFTERLAGACVLLLITCPCITVMLNFDNFRVMHNYKHIGELRL